MDINELFNMDKYDLAHVLSDSTKASEIVGELDKTYNVDAFRSFLKERYNITPDDYNVAIILTSNYNNPKLQEYFGRTPDDRIDKAKKLLEKKQNESLSLAKQLLSTKTEGLTNMLTTVLPDKTTDMNQYQDFMDQVTKAKEEIETLSKVKIDPEGKIEKKNFFVNVVQQILEGASPSDWYESYRTNVFKFLNYMNPNSEDYDKDIADYLRGLSLQYNESFGEQVSYDIANLGGSIVPMMVISTLLNATGLGEAATASYVEKIASKFKNSKQALKFAKYLENLNRSGKIGEFASQIIQKGIKLAPEVVKGAAKDAPIFAGYEAYKGRDIAEGLKSGAIFGAISGPIGTYTENISNRFIKLAAKHIGTGITFAAGNSLASGHIDDVGKEFTKGLTYSLLMGAVHGIGSKVGNIIGDKLLDAYIEKDLKAKEKKLDIALPKVDEEQVSKRIDSTIPALVEELKKSNNPKQTAEEIKTSFSECLYSPSEQQTGQGDINVHPKVDIPLRGPQEPLPEKNRTNYEDTINQLVDKALTEEKDTLENQVMEFVAGLDDTGVKSVVDYLQGKIDETKQTKDFETRSKLVGILDMVKQASGLANSPKHVQEKMAKLRAEKNQYVNHSGGANGSDTYWGEVGNKYGVKSNHYYVDGNKTPNGNVSLTPEQAKEADEHLIKANETLGRKFPASNEYVNNLLRRNWYQVKNADAVYAVSEIDNTGKVKGGTGWAVQMAIDENKPVYVFDQAKEQWHKWNGERFEETDTPTLTKNFAGIGTRKINDAGKKAIEEIYDKTFGRKEQSTVKGDPVAVDVLMNGIVSVEDGNVKVGNVEEYKKQFIAKAKETRNQLIKATIEAEKKRIKELREKHGELVKTAEQMDINDLKDQSIAMADDLVNKGILPYDDYNRIISALANPSRETASFYWAKLKLFPEMRYMGDIEDRKYDSDDAERSGTILRTMKENNVVKDKNGNTHVIEPAKILKANNMIVSAIHKADTVDDVVAELQKYLAGETEQVDKDIAHLFSVALDSHDDLVKTFNMVKAYRPYGVAGNIQRYVPMFSKGELELIPIQEEKSQLSGELNSWLNENLGNRVMYVTFGRDENDHRIPIGTDITLLNPQERTELIHRFFEKGWSVLFSRGATNTVFFGRIDGGLYDKDGNIIPAKESKARLKEEVGEDLVKDLEKDYKRINDIFDEDVFWADALNKHMYYKQIFGEDYLILGELNSITDIMKRGQIPTAKGTKDFYGNTVNHITLSGDAIKEFAGKEYDDTAYDGMELLHPELFDQLMKSQGWHSGDAFKAFYHNKVDRNAVGIKALFVKADPKQTEWMDKHGVKWVSFDTNTKYTGGILTNKPHELDISKLQFLWNEHYDFLDENGNPKPSYINMPSQFMGSILDDSFDPNRKVAIAALDALKEHLDSEKKRIVGEFEKAVNDPEKLQQILEKVFGHKEVNDLSEELNTILDDVAGTVNPIERALMGYGINMATVNIPWIRKYTVAAIRSYFYNRLIHPQYQGHYSLLRGRLGYDIDDNSFMMGYEARKMPIKLEDHQVTLGEIWDAFQNKSNTVTDIYGKSIKVKPEELDKVLSQFIIIRTPQENVSGARVLRFAGFGEPGTGAQVMVSKANMNALGGADNDGDKVAVLTGVDSRIVEYIKSKKDWTQPRDGKFENPDKHIKNLQKVVLRTQLPADDPNHLTEREAMQKLGMNKEEWKRHKEEVLLVSTKQSILNPYAAIEAVAKNANAKNNLARIVAMKRNLELLYANKVPLFDLRNSQELPPASVLNGKSDPKVIAITGKSKINQAIADSYFDELFSKLSESNPDHTVLIDADSPVALQAGRIAMNYGLPIELVGTWQSLNTRAARALKMYVNPVDSDTSPNYDGNGKVTVMKSIRDAEDYIASRAHELWYMDPEYKHNNVTLNAGKTGKAILDIGAYFNNELVKKIGMTKALLTDREHMDYVFKKWIRYAADAGKYGGMPEWKQVQARIFTELLGLSGLNREALASRLAQLVNDNPHLQSVRDLINVVRNKARKRDGTTYSNVEMLDFFNKFDEHFPDDKTGLEHVLKYLPDVDISISKVIDKSLADKVLKGVDKGYWGYYDFLKEYGYLSDKSIAKANMDTDHIDIELKTFAETILHAKDGDPILYTALDKMGLPGNTIKTLKDMTGVERVHFISKLFKEYPEVYRAALTEMKRRVDDYIIENIASKVTNDIYGYAMGNFEANYGVRPRSLSDPNWHKLSPEEQKKYLPAKMRYDDIKNKVDSIKKIWNDLWKDKSSIRVKRLEALKDMIKAYTPVPKADRLLYYAMLYGNRVGQLMAYDEKGIKLGHTNISKVGFIQDAMPLDILQEYGKRFDTVLKQMSKPKMYSFPANLIDGLKMVFKGSEHRFLSYLTDFVQNYDTYPKSVVVENSAKEFIEKAIDRSVDTLLDKPFTKEERQKLLDSIRLAKLGRRLLYVTDPDTKSNIIKLIGKLWLKIALPSSILQRTGPTRKLYDTASATIFEAEHYRVLSESLLRDAQESINQWIELYGKDREEGYKEASQKIFDYIENGVETDELLKQAASAFIGPRDFFGGKSLREVMHDILSETRYYNTKVLRNITLKRIVFDPKFASDFLNIPLQDIIKMDKQSLLALAADRLDQIFTERITATERGITGAVGYIEGYYPHFSSDPKSREEFYRIQLEQEDALKKLLTSGELGKDAYMAYLEKAFESPHARKRKANEEVEPRFIEDIDQYVGNVLRPYVRNKIHFALDYAIKELVESSDPTKRTGIYSEDELGSMKGLVEYLRKWANYAITGTTKDHYGTTDYIFDIASNVIGGSLLGANVKGSARNFMQRFYTLAEGGYKLYSTVKEWRDGKAEGLEKDSNGQWMRSFAQVSKEFGVGFGLSKEFDTGDVDDSFVTVMNKARIANQLAIIEDAEKRYGSTPELQKEKAKLNRELKKFDILEKGLRKARNYASRMTAGKYLPEKATETTLGKTADAFFQKISFKSIEYQNRMVAASTGYYLGYKDTFNRMRAYINEGLITPEQVDEIAHENGLRRARALVELTQYEYHSINMPEIFRGSSSKLLMQFKTFTWNHTAMLYKYLTNGARSAWYGGSSQEVKRMLRMLAIFGAAATVDSFLLHGFTNSWYSEIMDKAVNFYKLITGRDDAFWGKGWVGAVGSLPGPAGGYLFDFLTYLAMEMNGGVPDEQDKSFRRTYGIMYPPQLKDAFDQYGWSKFVYKNNIPGLWPTPHDLMNVLYNITDGKGNWERDLFYGLFHSTTGLSPAFFYGNKKKRMF